MTIMPCSSSSSSFAQPRPVISVMSAPSVPSQFQSVVSRLHVVFGPSFFVWLSFLAHGLFSHLLRLRRYFQTRDVSLGMKPLEDFQTPSLILLAAVFHLGVGRHDLERRRLVPASFDLGVNKRQEHFVVVTWNRRADGVELERLRVLNLR